MKQEEFLLIDKVKSLRKNNGAGSRDKLEVALENLQEYRIQKNKRRNNRSKK